MRFPLVSRAERDKALRELIRAKGEGSYMQKLLDEANADRRRLTDALLEMRRDGFNLGATEPPREPVKPLPSVVEAALDDIGLSGQERYEAEAYARRCMQEEIAPEEIRRRLYDGESTTPDEEEAA